MGRLRDTIALWMNVARMGSEELAAMTLPSWLLHTLHLKNEMRQDYIGLIAAGVAFYFLLAAFPALAAAISIYGFFLDPHLIADQLRLMARFLPPEALDIMMQHAAALSDAGHGSLSLSLAVSVLFTLYSATRGVQALIKGFNIAYNTHERRSLARFTLLSYGLTVLMVGYFLVALTLIAGLPAAVQVVRAPGELAELIRWLRWPLLFGMALVGLEILYTLGPCRRRPKIRITPGAIAATLLWLAGSSLFSAFISNFGSFNQIYGSLGAVVVLMLWFWVSALTILIGAEINGALETHGEKKNQREKLDGEGNRN